MKTVLAAVLVLGAVTVMSAGHAWADMSYVFMKMGCHPKSKSVSIHVFYKRNEEGRDLLKNHGADIYPIEDKKIISCDLGDGQKVTIGPSYTQPFGNSQNISITTYHMGITDIRGRYYLDYIDSFNLDFKKVGRGKFSARYCSRGKVNFLPKVRKKFESQFKENKMICELYKNEQSTYIVQGAVP